MDRIAAGLVIAPVAFALNGGIVREVFGEDIPRPVLSHGQAVSAQPSQLPVASGYRSERVMGLLLALEALRAAPEVLEPAQARAA